MGEIGRGQRFRMFLPPVFTPRHPRPSRHQARDRWARDRCRLERHWAVGSQKPGDEPKGPQRKLGDGHLEVRQKGGGTWLCLLSPFYPRGSFTF